MKKLLYAAMLLLGVGIMAVSCKKDDGISTKDYANAIVGEWKVEKFESYKDGKLSETEIPTAENHTTLIFSANGKVTTVDTYKGKTETYDYDYVLSGKTVSVAGEDYEIMKLTRKEMVWSLTYKTQEERVYFSRVK